MDRHNEWRKQVRLLLQILPFVSSENCFALKGGTAINLFVRDLPRLSVDIDLVYLPADDRETALAETGAALGRVADALEGSLPDIRVLRNYEAKSDALRIVASSRDATVKVELSPVLRGTVMKPAVVPVTPAVEEEFGFAEINMVAMEDLYAGKLCAALDRQHPRDWFDVMLLLESEGIGDALRKVFLVYLISHGRPMEELLAPNWRLQKSLFDSEFVGMTRHNVTLQDLHEAAVSALSKILDGMRREEKAFLCSVYECAPDWSLLALPGVEMLPAVKWKLRNIQRMSVEKRTTSLERLKTLLNFAE